MKINNLRVMHTLFMHNVNFYAMTRRNIQSSRGIENFE